MESILQVLELDTLTHSLVGSRAMGMEHPASDWDYIFRQEDRGEVMGRLSLNISRDGLVYRTSISSYGTVTLYGRTITPRGCQLIFLDDKNFPAWVESVKLMSKMPEDTKQFYKNNKRARVKTFNQFVVHFGGKSINNY